MEAGLNFRVNLGEETRPVIEKITFPLKDNTSLFKEQYIKAFEVIESYLTLLSDDRNKDPHTPRQNEQINNIIAFIGERGSGKSSCMNSVANTLQDKPEGAFDRNSYIGKTRFHTIDLIDPSFFDNKNNILSIIIAKLFSQFKGSTRKQSPNEEKSFAEKQHLVETFQKVQTNLNCIIEGKTLTDDDLEQLVSLSASINLCDDIRNLVDAYLAYMHKKEDVLIIRIDDIDLNTRHAHVMAEQIRKYFIHPNIIILLAVKIDQLSNVIKREYTEEFKLLIKKDQMTFGTIDEMVDKYLSKLIPHPQRVFLPDLQTFLEDPLTITYSNQGEEKTREFPTIRQAVPALIFEKTRYLFYNSQGKTSYIVPRNLRELRHIISLLWNMEDYLKDKKKEYNKLLFRKYLFETWTSNNLDIEGRVLINNIIEITDAVLINKSVIGLLKKRFADIIKLIEDNSPEMKLILREDNVTYNISIGDVMGLIYHLENISEKVVDQKLLFMIKTIYSMRLYEYYDQITEAQPNKINIEKEVKRNDYLKGMNNYQKLAGGNFINSGLASLLPASSSARSRNRRIINAELFYEKLDYVITDIDQLGDQTYIANLNLVEFFALTITRLEDTRSNYRTNQERYYERPLDNRNYKNLWFDISSFTYNLAFIKEAYTRFDPKLYSICKERTHSLLNKIYGKTEERHVNDNYHRWMSSICIRNVEVLQDFVLHLQNNKPKGDRNSLHVIRNFFLSASDFYIYSYDFEQNGNDHHDINFEFLNEITNTLDEVGPDEFERIFTEPKLIEEISTQPKRRLFLNIKLNLQGKIYVKSEIWRRLVEKNEYLLEDSIYREIYDEIFNCPDDDWMITPDVKQLLNQYKSKIESL